MKALIALDIDGTLAPEKEPIPPPVIDFLNSIKSKGHQIIFMTGRTYTFAVPMIKWLPQPFYLSVQNGAAVTEYPSKKVVFRKYLSPDIFPTLDLIFKDKKNDYLVEGGVEKDDRCFFRSQNHTKEQLEYIRFRENLAKEKWIDTPSYDEAGIGEFPLIKCFGEKKFIDRVAHEIVEALGLHIPVIHDPFIDNGYISMGTHPEVSKGFAIQSLRTLIDPNLFLIAAGDDNNDVSMLEVADFGIAMETGPKVLLEKADYIAASAKQMGIIPAINEALKRCEG